MRSVHSVRTYYAPPMAPYDRAIRVNSDPAKSAGDWPTDRCLSRGPASPAEA